MHYKFNLLPLPYEYDALEPFIDTQTMHLHHDKHLKTYTDNLNKALDDYPQYHSWSLERLLLNINWLPSEIRTAVERNAGGVYNHIFYFENMSPNGGRTPKGALADAMNKAFGSYDNFKKQFRDAALSVFGSGYAWLTADDKGELKIITTGNQETPLPRGLTPIMTIDVWEHAYYLKHYNVRADYITDWFGVADLDKASAIYEN